MITSIPHDDAMKKKFAQQAKDREREEALERKKRGETILVPREEPKEPPKDLDKDPAGTSDPNKKDLVDTMTDEERAAAEEEIRRKEAEAGDKL